MHAHHAVAEAAKGFVTGMVGTAFAGAPFGNPEGVAGAVGVASALGAVGLYGAIRDSMELERECDWEGTARMREAWENSGRMDGDS